MSLTLEQIVAAIAQSNPELMAKYASTASAKPANPGKARRKGKSRASAGTFNSTMAASPKSGRRRKVDVNAPQFKLVGVPAALMKEIKEYSDDLAEAWQAVKDARSAGKDDSVAMKRFVNIKSNAPQRDATRDTVKEYLGFYVPQWNVMKHETILRSHHRHEAGWLFVETKHCPLGSEVRMLIDWLGFEKTGKAGLQLVHKIGKPNARRSPFGSRKSDYVPAVDD